MKQFIISEQEKSRILEMHQNATSRQYLMEDDKGHDGQLIYVFLPWKKNAEGKAIPAKEAYTKPDYVATFKYSCGMVDSSNIENNKNVLPDGFNITKIEDSTGNITIPAMTPQSYDVKGNFITGKCVPPSTAKISFGIFPSYSVTFKDGGEVNPIFVHYKQGKEYIPTQK